jgi:tuftelin-interacting protein 11
MNDATRLGEDTKYRLKRPELHFPSTISGKPSKTKPRQLPTAKPPEDQISFRSIVEETVAESDLVFQPTGRSHEGTGSHLFRISKGIDGKGGVTVYLRDDVVWMSDGATWKPVGIYEVVARAKSG